MNIFARKRNRKSCERILLVGMLVPLLAFTLTGCQMIEETFGKEYRMIDDAFEQLEADIVYTLEEYAEEEGFTDEEWAEKQIYLDQMVADLHVAKEQTKNWLRTGEAMQEDLGTNVSVEAYVESALMEFRVALGEELEEATDGAVTLKSTKVNRGFFGSIWNFIRNHWLISLIILGLIGSIPEFIENIAGDKKKTSSSTQKME